MTLSQQSGLSSRSAALFPWVFLAVCALVFVRVSAVGWHNSILGYAGFRQAQTAINADYLLRDGFTLAYETPVLGAPWSLPFEFPTYQFCVVALVKVTGIGLEPAGRLVSIAFAAGAFALLFLFVRRGTGSIAAAAMAAGLVMVTPLYLFYSRTFMIESTALCFGLALLVSVQAFLERPSGKTIGLIFLTGLLAGLTKATTYAISLAAIAPLLLCSARSAWAQLVSTQRAARLVIGAGLALAIPFGAALAWVGWTDAVKLRNPLAAFTTSSALHDWNYGTWAQRLDPKTWARIGQALSSLVVGFPFVWLAIGLMTAGWLLWLRRERPPAMRARGFVLAGVAGFVAGPLVFTNLYFVHDYYFYATALYLPVLAGGLTGLLWERGGRTGKFAGAIACLVLAGASVRTYMIHCYAAQRADDPSLPAFGARIAALTPPESVILIEGSEWDSSLAYYAHRRALTNRTKGPITDPAFQRALARLDHPLGAVVVRETRKDDRYFLARQMRGLRRPFERAFASPLGDVYLPPGPDGKLRREQDWRRAGFTAMPLFSYARTVELTPFAGRQAMLVHAPGVVILARDAAQRVLHVGFGLREDTYTQGHRTDGVSFNVEFNPDDGGPMQRLLTAQLNPVDVPADRGLHSASLPLPANTPGTITFYTESGASDAFDWSVWCDVRLE